MLIAGPAVAPIILVICLPCCLLPHHEQIIIHEHERASIELRLKMLLVYIKDEDIVRYNDLYIVARGVIPKNAGEIKIMEDDIQPGYGGFQPGQPASSRRFRHKTPTQRLAAGVVFARIKIPKWVYWARKICQKPFPEIVVVLPKDQGIRGRWMN